MPWANNGGGGAVRGGSVEPQSILDYGQVTKQQADEQSSTRGRVSALRLAGRGFDPQSSLTQLLTALHSVFRVGLKGVGSAMIPGCGPAQRHQLRRFALRAVCSH